MKNKFRNLLGFGMVMSSVMAIPFIAAGCNKTSSDEGENFKADFTDINANKKAISNDNELLKNCSNDEVKNFYNTSVAPIYTKYEVQFNDAKDVQSLNTLRKQYVEEVKKADANKVIETQAATLRTAYLAEIDAQKAKINGYAKQLLNLKKAIDAADKDKKEVAKKARTDFVAGKQAEMKTLKDKIVKLYEELRAVEQFTDLQTIKIFHTNDEHGRILADDFKYNNYIGMTGTAAFYEGRNPELILSAGDLIQGLPMNDSDKGETITQMAQLMGYQAVAIGNHEFDFGLDNILKLDKMSTEKGMPYLSANVVYKKGIKKDGKDVSGKHVFQPYIIKTLSTGVKAAIFGITTPDTAWTSHPRNSKDVIFQQPVEAAQKTIDEIKKYHPEVNFVIALTHLGVGRTTLEWNSTYLAENVTGLDLIIDGHSHTYVPVHTSNAAGKEVNYDTQTQCYTQFVGDIDLVLNTKTGLITDMKQTLWDINDMELINGKLLTTSSLLEGEYKKLIGPLEEKFEQVKAEKLFISDVEFKHTDEVTVAGLPYWRGRVEPTNLGIFASDALAWDFVNNKKPSKITEALTLDNVVGLMNGGGLRTNLNKGQITKGDMLALAPFGNRISAVGIKGKTLKEMFAHGVDFIGAGGYGQYSHNVSMEILYEDVADPKNPSQKTRKNTIKEGTLKVNGKEIKDDKTYYVVTNDYICAGGDKYTMIKKNDPKVPGVDDVFEGGDLIESLVDYAKFLNQNASTPANIIAKPFAIEFAKYGEVDSNGKYTITNKIVMTQK